MGGVVRPRLVELADASNKPLRVRTGKIGQHDHGQVFVRVDDECRAGTANACDLARARGLDVVQADVTAEGWSPEGPVDYIVMSEVLEHLPAPERLLLRLKDVCRRRLLIDVPNTGAINDRLRLLFGRTPKQWVFHPEEHLRFWTIPDFLLMCRQLGLKVERYYGLYDPYFDFGLPWWRIAPGLLSRYVLYELSPTGEAR